ARTASAAPVVKELPSRTRTTTEASRLQRPARIHEDGRGVPRVSTTAPPALAGLGGPNMTRVKRRRREVRGSGLSRTTGSAVRPGRPATTWAASVGGGGGYKGASGGAAATAAVRSRLAKRLAGSGGGSYCGGSGCSAITGGQHQNRHQSRAEAEAPASTELRQQQTHNDCAQNWWQRHLTFAAEAEARGSSRSKSSRAKLSKRSSKSKRKLQKQEKKLQSSSREAAKKAREAAKAREAGKSKSSSAESRGACLQAEALLRQNDQFKLPRHGSFWRVIKSKKIRNSFYAKAMRQQQQQDKADGTDASCQKSASRLSSWATSGAVASNERQQKQVGGKRGRVQKPAAAALLTGDQAECPTGVWSRYDDFRADVGAHRQMNHSWTATGGFKVRRGPKFSSQCLAVRLLSEEGCGHRAASGLSLGGPMAEIQGGRFAIFYYYLLTS
uniref:AP2/ERF domain-containing protein n=1 Tax=Macrostomum lignano TaxID=282301 RepID=A0A1I8JPJ5_9PLAT